MRRKSTTKNGVETVEPYLCSNIKYRIELEIEGVSELLALVRGGSLAGKAVRGSRMKGHFGSGPSVIPVSDISI
jgi:hypothetical protein